ncbi:hypothetical protein [Curtobacterium sp. MCSS17_015]|nr:hypothetical protein [Curtobacterium sp. MCSS17_015]WIB25277.1 hypothetical protein DEJ18_09385 [Curtobacterium sp. MCSS17_015]
MQQLLQYPDVSRRRRRSAMTHAVVPAALPARWRGRSAEHGMIVGWR